MAMDFNVGILNWKNMVFRQWITFAPFGGFWGP
jgi:hypothetical protein